MPVCPEHVHGQYIHTYVCTDLGGAAVRFDGVSCVCRIHCIVLPDALTVPRACVTAYPSVIYPRQSLPFLPFGTADSRVSVANARRPNSNTNNVASTTLGTRTLTHTHACMAVRIHTNTRSAANSSSVQILSSPHSPSRPGLVYTSCRDVVK